MERQNREDIELDTEQEPDEEQKTKKEDLKGQTADKNRDNQEQEELERTGVGGNGKATR